MGAEVPVRRPVTAKELAAKHGYSERTVRRLAAETRAAFLARAAARREEAAALRRQGKTYKQIAEIMEVPIGTVGSIIKDARERGINVHKGSGGP